MKRLFLLSYFLVNASLAGMQITPTFVGNGTTDSVIVSFCTFDTTFYPTIADADSIVALRYAPDNSLLDSLTQSAGNLFNPRNGWYEIHYRGADGSGTLGNYRVYIRARIGGDWRGAATATYQVIDEEINGYLSKIYADGDSLKDTLAALLHGDSATIARAVWDDDLVGKTGRRIGWADSVDFVNNIPGSGSGAYACTLLVLRTDDSAAVQGVFLRAMNSSETTTAAIGNSDSNGRAIFSLDNTEYRIYSYLGGYRFAALPETVTVATSGINDTIWATGFDPGSAPSASLCRVYGYLQSLTAGNLEGVSVSARIMTTPLSYQGMIISPYSVAATTDSLGYWQLDLYPNSQLSPANTSYDFTVYDVSGTILRKQVIVPDSVSFFFTWE